MGALLFHGNCVTCHYETTERSAPSMQEVRKRYKEAFPNKPDFIKYLSEWVHDPDADKSIMQDAIAKHELMPQLAYEKDVLEEIAAYIYDTDFTKRHPFHK
ncbi:cytochrome C [Sulfurimonas paralvinellae]|uniref:Cytochrome C n=2 Tax=Sulfurimonas paralvinellae TaxID=317658 RepID=A0A7M1BCY3_9BACT|nr:cytochrome C [Sulfurimonas paralvinellae]